MVGTSPLADIPADLLARLPHVIRLKYLTPVNRWTALAGSVATLREATGGDLSRSRLWRELLGPAGVVDVMSSAFVDRWGCWGFLDLWRSGSEEAFTADDVALLAGLRQPITTALRRCQAAAFAAGDARESRRTGPNVLLLRPDLTVLGQTPSTQAYIQTLVPPSDGRSPIPAGAYNVGAQLLAVEAAADGNPPWARVHLREDQWLTLRAARVAEDGATAAGRAIAVTIEEAGSGERLGLFGRSHGLSPREQELLAHLATGVDTREVAARLFLSPHTVQDHLKAIFSKCGVRTRPALLARALGA